MGHKVSRTMREKASLLCDDELHAAVHAYCGKGAVFDLIGDETFIATLKFIPTGFETPDNYRGFFGGRQIIHIYEDDTLPKYMAVMRFEDAEYSFEIPH